MALAELVDLIGRWSPRGLVVVSLVVVAHLGWLAEPIGASPNVTAENWVEWLDSEFTADSLLCGEGWHRIAGTNTFGCQHPQHTAALAEHNAEKLLVTTGDDDRIESLELVFDTSPVSVEDTPVPARFGDIVEQRLNLQECARVTPAALGGALIGCDGWSVAYLEYVRDDSHRGNHRLWIGEDIAVVEASFRRWSAKKHRQLSVHHLSAARDFLRNGAAAAADRRLLEAMVLLEMIDEPWRRDIDRRRQELAERIRDDIRAEADDQRRRYATAAFFTSLGDDLAAAVLLQRRAPELRTLLGEPLDCREDPSAVASPRRCSWGADHQELAVHFQRGLSYMVDVRSSPARFATAGAAGR